MKSKTFTIEIAQSAKKVYAFVSDLRNLPKWAPAFCLSIQKRKGKWAAQTPQGPVTLQMAAPNKFGVLDHHVFPAPGVDVFVPMRVVANGKGSEVVFTLFRMPGMSEARFKQDQKLVARDLQSLKRVLSPK